jgi:hypothetical protein
VSVDRNRLEMWRLRGRLNKRQRTVGKTNELKMELRGRRGAPRAMQRKRIARSCVLRERKIPGDKLRRADEVEGRSRQRRHVQRLTNMAGGIGAFRVFVKETAARGKVQQRSASQQRQRAAHSRPFKQESKAIHRPDLP